MCGADNRLLLDWDLIFPGLVLIASSAVVILYCHKIRYFELHWDKPITLTSKLSPLVITIATLFLFIGFLLFAFGTTYIEC